jgi:hypothetical protein
MLVNITFKNDEDHFPAIVCPLVLAAVPAPVKILKRECMYMDMRLQIEKEVTLENIQKQFNQVFPFLKLEFFSSLNGKKRTPALPERLKPEQKAYCCSKMNDTAVNIDIDRQMTVAGLENEFLEKTGLGVLVYRKSGKVWIETSLTNDWTLEQQNSEGESISNH